MPYPDHLFDSGEVSGDGGGFSLQKLFEVGYLCSVDDSLPPGYQFQIRHPRIKRGSLIPQADIVLIFFIETLKHLRISPPLLIITAIIIKSPILIHDSGG